MPTSLVLTGVQFPDNSIQTTAATASTGGGGATATGNVTLIASSPGAQSITPTNYGNYVTLPNATTCSRGSNLFSISNAGVFPLGIKNTSGSILGWVPAEETAIVGLADNSAAAGVWNITNTDPIAATAVSLQGGGFGPVDVFELDSNRTFVVLASNNDTYGMVYDQSTLAFGARTLLFSGSSQFTIVKPMVTAAGNPLGTGVQGVLVCSISGSTLTTRIVQISGTTLTVSTPTTPTRALPGSISGSGPLGLVACGSTMVLSYIATALFGLGMQWTGTNTITYGGNAQPRGGEEHLFGSFALSSTTGITFWVETANSYMWGMAFTVSGTTVTYDQSGTSFVSNNNNEAVVRRMGSRFLVIPSSGLGALYTPVSGTTVTRTTFSAPLTAGGVFSGDFYDGQMSSTKWVFGSRTDLYILTDNAGTAQTATIAVNFTSRAIVAKTTATTASVYALSAQFTDGFSSFPCVRLFEVESTGNTTLVRNRDTVYPLQNWLSGTNQSQGRYWAIPGFNYSGLTYPTNNSAFWMLRTYYSGIPTMVGVDSQVSVCINGAGGAFFNGQGLTFRELRCVPYRQGLFTTDGVPSATSVFSALVGVHLNTRRLFAFANNPTNGSALIYVVEAAV